MAPEDTKSENSITEISFTENSVTQYIDGLKQGSELAAQKVWERFIGRLIRIADRKLKASPRKAMNEEDVVQQAFAEFFAQVQQGRFPKLNDRNDLWQVLAMLVDRRAKDQIRKLNTLKAGGGRERTESVFMVVGGPDEQAGINGVVEIVPTPEMAAELMELFRIRVADLKEEYQEIALLKMQGYTNQEIADMLESSLRTIERRLDQIRTIWSSDSKS